MRCQRKHQGASYDHEKAIAAVALVAVLQVSAVHAAYLFVFATGVDTGGCTNASSPCLSIAYTASQASFLVQKLPAWAMAKFRSTIAKSVTIDCNGTMTDFTPMAINGSGITVVLKNFAMIDYGGGVTVTNGNLIMENVLFRYINGQGSSALEILPTALSKVVVKNCIFDDNVSGVLIKPASGGSVSATFDHVTIAANTGGGIKTDTTNGPITIEITDSIIKDNTGNGINAVDTGANPNVVSIEHGVIAKNGTAGVQVNGANAAAMMDTTLLDSNATGATSVVAGGHMLTYGSNRIVGPHGSGFTGSASLQ